MPRFEPDFQAESLRPIVTTVTEGAFYFTHTGSLFRFYRDPGILCGVMNDLLGVELNPILEPDIKRVPPITPAPAGDSITAAGFVSLALRPCGRRRGGSGDRRQAGGCFAA
jgi:hypothetical protein